MSRKTTCNGFFETIGTHFCRRKLIVPSSDENKGDEEKPRMEKCLNLFDLVSLGTASTIGSGMYVVLGITMKHLAGPAVVISFTIAGLISLLSGLCYAEFGCRVPKTAGGAYVYSYVTIGELVAFITGWTLILEYMIGTAAGGVAISNLIDTLSNEEISKFMTNHTFAVISRTYPDFIAFSICLFITGILVAGVKSSIIFNHVFNAINFIVWIFIVIAGSIYARPQYWTDFGFMPFGLEGILNAAPTCFYAFIGFDIIASTGEECKDAAKSIPKAILITIFLILSMYVSSSIILSMLVPYYEININSALVYAWKQRKIIWAMYIVVVGAIATLTVSLLGSAFPMPRIIYAMGCDGLIMKWFAEVNKYTKAPVNATLVSGIMAGLLSLFIGIGELVEMMSIGTLLAYTMVSLSILILRYRPNIEDELYIKERLKNWTKDVDEKSSLSHKNNEKSYGTCENFNLHQLSQEEKEKIYNTFEYSWKLGLTRSQVATEQTSNRVIRCITAMIVMLLLTCILLVTGEKKIADGNLLLCVIVSLLFFGVCCCLFFLKIQPESRKQLSFMTPAVPYIPCLALFFNIYLTTRLKFATWIRFTIWMTIGFVIYFSYGIRHAPKIYEERLQILIKLKSLDPEVASQCSKNSKNEESSEYKFKEHDIEETCDKTPLKRR